MTEQTGSVRTNYVKDEDLTEKEKTWLAKMFSTPTASAETIARQQKSLSVRQAKKSKEKAKKLADAKAMYISRHGEESKRNTLMIKIGLGITALFVGLKVVKKI
jgi:hypothetical protein